MSYMDKTFSKIKILKNYEPKIYVKNESLTDLYEISNDFMKKIYLTLIQAQIKIKSSLIKLLVKKF